MRSEEYSEWDEYIGLSSMKRITENAITKIAEALTLLRYVKDEGESTSKVPDAHLTALEKLDIVRVTLIAMRNEFSECSMVGTRIKHGKVETVEEGREK